MRRRRGGARRGRPRWNDLHNKLLSLLLRWVLTVRHACTRTACRCAGCRIRGCRRQWLQRDIQQRRVAGPQHRHRQPAQRTVKGQANQLPTCSAARAWRRHCIAGRCSSQPAVRRHGKHAQTPLVAAAGSTALCRQWHLRRHHRPSCPARGIRMPHEACPLGVHVDAGWFTAVVIASHGRRCASVVLLDIRQRPLLVQCTFVIIGVDVVQPG